MSHRFHQQCGSQETAEVNEVASNPETPQFSDRYPLQIRTHFHELLLSVVICALNEEGYIENILDDLAKSEIAPDKFEIIVADSGSSDRTPAIVREFAQKHEELNVQLVELSEKGVSKARNGGAEQARGQVICFYDADTRLRPDTLANTYLEMEARNLDIAAYYLTPQSPRLDDRFMFFWGNPVIGGGLQYTDHPSSVGAGIVVRRKLHQKLGGFDEGLRYAEDLNYGRRAKRLGNFAMLRSTDIGFSMRRFDREGRLLSWAKVLKGFAYYLLNIEEIGFDYEFGVFSKGKTSDSKV